MHCLEMPRIVCDFETYSEAVLKDVGVWAYAQHPSTEILMMSHKYMGQPAELWLPGDPFPEYIIEHVLNGFPIEAHNCGFERAIWETILIRDFGIPVPKKWIDTMAVCAYKSIPLKLENAGDVLDLVVQKDARGKKLIQQLTKPRKPTKKDPRTRIQDHDLMVEFGEYCKQDSEAEYALGDALGDLTTPEFSVWALDQRINYRGVRVDVPAVLAALKIVDEVTEKLTLKLREVTDGKIQTAGQTDKMLQFANDNGCYLLVNMTAGHLDEVIERCWPRDMDPFSATFGQRRFADETDEKVFTVLNIRQRLGKASTKKLLKFRDSRSIDNRIRGLLMYHGAGTGRWAGRGVQPQNFPRGGMGIDMKATKWTGETLMEALIACIKEGDADLLELQFGDPMEAIAHSLRGMFIATEDHNFHVADFAAIEARVLMWLAGQDDAVQAFADFDEAEEIKPGSGTDVYCVMASKIYGKPINKKEHPEERQQGKVVILGCGYQMGGKALMSQAQMNYGVTLTLKQAVSFVDIFRTTYTKVPELWKNLEQAAIEAVRTKGSTEVINSNGVRIGFEYVKDQAGTWLTMILPNGKRLWYFSPGLEEKTIPYADKETGEMKTFTKLSLYYAGRSNKASGAWGRVWTYGGMLTENAVQAISRELMVAAMFRVEAAGYKILMTIHDEIVGEAPDDGRNNKEFERLMRGPVPKWATGCPVNVEGWVGKRYRKG